MKDRIPLYPGRVKLVPVAGEENTYDLVRADQPSQAGTPLNKSSLLKDTTAALYGLDENAVPDDVLAMLPESLKVLEEKVPDKHYGIDWNYNAFDTEVYSNSYYYKKIVNGNNVIVSIQDGNASAKLSRDGGKSWESINLSNYLTYIYGLAFGNGRFVFTGLNGKWVSTTDFESWETGAFQTTDDYLVEFGNGMFVAMNSTASKKMFSTSEDGVTWTNRTHNLSVASYGFYTSAFVNGIFLFAMDGSNHALKSVDGLNWTYESTPNSSGVLSGTIGNYFVFHAYNSYNTYLSADGAKWQKLLSSMLYPAYEDESKFYFFSYSSTGASEIAKLTSVNKDDIKTGADITAGSNIDLPTMEGWTYSGDWRSFLRGQRIISRNRCIVVAWSCTGATPGVFITENTFANEYVIETSTGNNMTSKVYSAIASLIPTPESLNLITGTTTVNGAYNYGSTNNISCVLPVENAKAIIVLGPYNSSNNSSQVMFAVPGYGCAFYFYSNDTISHGSGNGISGTTAQFAGSMNSVNTGTAYYMCWY